MYLRPITVPSTCFKENRMWVSCWHLSKSGAKVLQELVRNTIKTVKLQQQLHLIRSKETWTGCFSFPWSLWTWLLPYKGLWIHCLLHFIQFFNSALRRSSFHKCSGCECVPGNFITVLHSSLSPGLQRTRCPVLLSDSREPRHRLSST